MLFSHVTMHGDVLSHIKMTYKCIDDVELRKDE